MKQDMTETTVTKSRSETGEWVAQLRAEHAALIQHLATVQQQVTAHCKALQQREQATLAENLRLRAELLVVRTAVYWGLREGAPRRQSTQRTTIRAPIPANSPDAQAVICQTGCAGHAHPWLEPGGECGRSGEPCRALTESLASKKT